MLHGDPLAVREHWILDNDRTCGTTTEAMLGRKRIYRAIHMPDMSSEGKQSLRRISEDRLDQVVFWSDEQPFEARP